MYRLSGFADEISESLDKQIEVIKKLGMNYIECRGVDGSPLISHTTKEAEEIHQRLSENGIELSSIGSSIGKIKITDDFEPHFDLFRHTVDIAHIFGVRNIRMFSFFMPEGEDPSGYQSEVMRRLEKLADYAAKNDVTLLHENEKEIYGDIASRCLEILKRFYSDSFCGVFDFANFVQCGQDTLEAWEMLKPYTEYIHVKDALKADGSVVPPGQGDGNLRPILRDLKEMGYDGFFSLEPHLADFTGYSALEGGKSIKDERKLTGEEAFTLSHDSFLSILKELEWA